MVWMLVKMLAVSVAVLAVYLWLLMRIAHGGKGWPRLRRRRRAHTRGQSRIGFDPPLQSFVDRLCHVP